MLDQDVRNEGNNMYSTERKYVNMGMFQLPKGNFNPIFFENQYDRYLLNYTFEPLFTYDKKMDLTVPVLAESWDFSKNYKELLIRLRDDVSWHDNSPFTADDVIFTLETIASPHYEGARFYIINNIEGAEEKKRGMSSKIVGLNKADDHTIIINFRGINVAELAKLAQLSPIPKHIYEGLTPSEMKNHYHTVKKPIGNGLFKFEEITSLEHITLTRNKDYFEEDKPCLDEVHFRLISKENTQQLLYEDKIDAITGLTPDVYQAVKDLNNIIIKENQALSYQYLGFKTNLDKLNNKRLRNAINYSIDKDYLVNKLLAGHGHVQTQPIPKACWAYNQELERKSQFNLDKARGILEEEGYIDIDNDGFVEDKRGHKFTLTIDYPEGNLIREQSAKIIAENIRSIGINVNLNPPREFSELSELVQKDDVELWLSGWSMSPDPDTAASGVWLSTDRFNYPRWVNNKSDELIKEAVSGESAKSTSLRKKIYKEWTELISDENPYVFLYSQNLIEVFNKKLKGIKYDWRGGIDSRGIKEWYS